MARIGRALVEAISSCGGHGFLRGWMPADCPSEVVVDLITGLDAAEQRVAEQATRIEQLEKQQREQREGLRPFAEQMDAYDDREDDTHLVWIDHPYVKITVGDLRRARSLLSDTAEDRK